MPPTSRPALGSLCTKLGGVLVLVVAVLASTVAAVHMKRIPVVPAVGMLRGSTTLPCDVSHPPGDSIVLLLWFRDTLSTPIYRLDKRLKGSGGTKDDYNRKDFLPQSWWTSEEERGEQGTQEGRRQKDTEDEEDWRGRLEVKEGGRGRGQLRVRDLREGDQGLYTCRVDFRRHPTKTTRVNLTVVVPVDGVVVLEGSEVTGPLPPLPPIKSPPAEVRVGPYLEGDLVQLTCVAYGGRPRPSVLWYQGPHLLDYQIESNLPIITTTLATTTINTTTTVQPPLTTPSPLTTTIIPTTITTTSQGTSPDLFTTLGPPDEASHGPYNTVTLGPLTRNHLHLRLRCDAPNNNMTLPVTLNVTLDMRLPPLSVVIPDITTEGVLVAGVEYSARCEVAGSAPSPAINWSLGALSLSPVKVTSSNNGNLTVSHLLLLPRREDHLATLTCSAVTPGLNDTLAANTTLTVHYAPVARLTLGSSLRRASIKEGDDVYFECHVIANPKVTRVTWRHNDQPLKHNVSGGVIVSNQSLVLQKVVRGQGGRYCCLAHNRVAASPSNTITLHVKYAPVCRQGQKTTYAVSHNEDAEVTCRVDSSPVQHTFHWTFNNTADTIDVPQDRFTSLVTHSVITYTPMTSLDYGTLLCWGVNDIGTQKVPCVFHIVPAGKPDPPVNCSVTSGSSVGVVVGCDAGASGGLPQHFHLSAVFTPRNQDHHYQQLHQQQQQHQQQHLTINITNMNQPEFVVEGLEESGRYQLHITAVNEKGMSQSTVLTVTSQGTNHSVYHLDDGPSEAEVRDGGNQKPLDEEVAGEADKVNKGLDSFLALPSFMAGILGIGSVFILLLILLVLLLALRARRKRRMEQRVASSSPSSSCSSSVVGRERKEPRRSESTASILSPDDICLQRDLQVASTESETEPDVIPLRESGVVECPSLPSMTHLLPATIMPPEGYTCFPATLPLIKQSTIDSTMLPGDPNMIPMQVHPGREGHQSMSLAYYPVPEHMPLHPTYLYELTHPATVPRKSQTTIPSSLTAEQFSSGSIKDISQPHTTETGVSSEQYVDSTSFVQINPNTRVDIVIHSGGAEPGNPYGRTVLPVTGTREEIYNALLGTGLVNVGSDVLDSKRDSGQLNPQTSAEMITPSEHLEPSIQTEKLLYKQKPVHIPNKENPLLPPPEGFLDSNKCHGIGQTGRKQGKGDGSYDAPSFKKDSSTGGQLDT